MRMGLLQIELKFHWPARSINCTVPLVTNMYAKYRRIFLYFFLKYACWAKGLFTACTHTVAQQNGASKKEERGRKKGRFCLHKTRPRPLSFLPYPPSFLTGFLEVGYYWIWKEIVGEGKGEGGCWISFFKEMEERTVFTMYDTNLFNVINITFLAKWINFLCFSLLSAQVGCFLKF